MARLLVSAGADLYVGPGGSEAPGSVLRRLGGPSLPLLAELDLLSRGQTAGGKGEGARGAPPLSPGEGEGEGEGEGVGEGCLSRCSTGQFSKGILCMAGQG